MRCVRTSKRATRGSSLLEAMISLSVLALGLTGIIAALLAAGRLDRRTGARAAAHAVAMDLARTIERWDFSDPRLAPVNDYAGAAFSAPRVTAFSVTHGAPSTVTETLSPEPDHGEPECGFCGRDLGLTNGTEPGRTYVFRRYWNVVVVPGNPHLKLVAVHVTYGQDGKTRGVATVYTSVMNAGALLPSMMEGSL